MTEQQQTFIAHLIELRARIIKCLIATAIVFLLLVSFANQIYQFIATPLIAQLPDNSSMIATEVAAPFLAPFKLTLFVAVLLVMPYLLFQAWGFVAPGLYEHEKRFALPLLVSSIMLFYLGLAFAFYAVFPLLFKFFASIAPEGVTIMTDISRYLDFILKLFFAFGLAFEVPVATLLLIKVGITNVNSLKQKRPYVIIAAFVIGMLLTPPDIISQILLALPIWLLFELGLYLADKFIKPVDEDSAFMESPE